MTTPARPMVRYIFPISHRFRAPFHEHLRRRLAEERIDYEVVYCAPFGDNVSKADTHEIPWGMKVPLARVPGTPVLFQFAFSAALSADLVIIQQENRLLLNYLLQLLPRFLRPRIAFFGHGRNFQSRFPHGNSEKWKMAWARHCDWWFAYTGDTRLHLEQLGYPPDRITVFNNASDTTALRRLARDVTASEQQRRRQEIGLTGDNVGVYVGGLYDEKRIDFLVSAADHVRLSVPDFELLIIGGGPSGPELESLVQSRPWIKLLGPRFGQDQVQLMSLGKLFLMPGLVGLAILDAGVLGLPVMTTDYPWHSPEIAYLEDGLNGIKVADWQNPFAYASAITQLFRDPARLSLMSEDSRNIASKYSIEDMAARFAVGVQAALSAPLRIERARGVPRGKEVRN